MRLGSVFGSLTHSPERFMAVRVRQCRRPGYMCACVVTSMLTWLSSTSTLSCGWCECHRCNALVWSSSVPKPVVWIHCHRQRHRSRLFVCVSTDLYRCHEGHHQRHCSRLCVILVKVDFVGSILAGVTMTTPTPLFPTPLTHPTHPTFPHPHPHTRTRRHTHTQTYGHTRKR